MKKLMAYFAVIAIIALASWLIFGPGGSPSSDEPVTHADGVIVAARPGTVKLRRVDGSVLSFRLAPSDNSTVMLEDLKARASGFINTRVHFERRAGAMFITSFENIPVPGAVAPQPVETQTVPQTPPSTGADQPTDAIPYKPGDPPKGKIDQPVASPSRPMSRQLFNRIKPGMTPQDVLKLAGVSYNEQTELIDNRTLVCQHWAKQGEPGLYKICYDSTRSAVVKKLET